MPAEPAVLSNLASTLYAAGKFDEAANRYGAALTLNPNHPQAHFGLGNCRLAQSRWVDALACYQEAYRLMPDNYDVNMSMGKANVNVGRLEEAQACFRRAAGLAANPAIALRELAWALQLQGCLDEALRFVEQSLEHRPDDADTLAERAQIYCKLDNLEAAHRDILALVDRGQVTPRIVLAWGEICGRFGECAEAIARAEALIDNAPLSKTDAISLHYLLGRLQDRADDYDRAFSHYYKANTLLPSHFDRKGHRALVEVLRSGYSREAFPSLARSVCKDERPVFIVGMPRSGTSLVEQILASHTQVFGAGELNHIKTLAGELLHGQESRLSAHLAGLRSPQLDALADRYLNLLGREATEARRVTDKMPANFLWLGLIAQMFPRAHVIHCVRDPRDICLSIYFQQFSQAHPYAQDLDDLVFYYRCYETMMSHWQQVLDLPLLEVRYEQLVDDLEGQARRMLDFLGLTWDEGCLRFHRSGRAAATASWGQVRQPIYTRSVHRWRRYQAHLHPLIAEFGNGDTVTKPRSAE